MKLSATIVGLAAILPAVMAVPEWGQCGGWYYTGPTTCDAGSNCVVLNEWYSQCLKASTSSTPPPRTSTISSKTSSSTKVSSSTKASSTKVSSTKVSSTIKSSSTKISSSSSTKISSSSTIPSSTSSSTSASPSPSGVCPGGTKFQYFGVNESCAEFGDGKVPGILNTDYTWPSPSSIDFFLSKGMNAFRIPFMLERLCPPATGITGAFDATYLQGLKTIVSYITGKGGYAAIEPHNYARFNGSVITDYAGFQTFWQNLAAVFAADSHVVFDMMNEPYGIPATDAASLMQAGINGVRASGATQLILVEGTSWTGAWTWISSGNAAAFVGLTDPLDNFAFEMHQYLDTDGSGTNATCVSPTVGAERLAAASAWLVANNKKGLLGELGAGSNDGCIAAIKGALCHMQQQGGAWLGMFWWAAGPWWGTYYQSMEPPSSPAVARILPEALLPFV